MFRFALALVLVLALDHCECLIQPEEQQQQQTTGLRAIGSDLSESDDILEDMLDYIIEDNNIVEGREIQIPCITKISTPGNPVNGSTLLKGTANSRFINPDSMILPTSRTLINNINLQSIQVPQLLYFIGASRSSVFQPSTSYAEINHRWLVLKQPFVIKVATQPNEITFFLLLSIEIHFI